MTGFPSASVPGWNSSRLPTDYVGMADVSRRARGPRPCPRHERTTRDLRRPWIWSGWDLSGDQVARWCGAEEGRLLCTQMPMP